MTLTERASRLNYASGRPDLPALILMSDEQRLPDPSAAAERLAPGSAILVRHSNAAARRELAERLAPLCRARHLLLLISDDIELARACHADGLHLPQQRAAAADAQIVRRRWPGLLSAAAHDSRALQRAARIGADAALVSPVFATASHPGGQALGLMRFLTLCRAAKLPVYALGGIHGGNAARLRERNVVGIAAIGGLI